MNYTKLASEARKLYDAFREEHFDENQSYYLTKECVRDYPIFREMIEKEEPGEVKGYIHFIAGSKIPIYSTSWDSLTNSMILCTPEGTYRMSDEMVYDINSFGPSMRSVYYAHDGNSWYRLYTIDHVEFLERKK